MNIEIKNYLSRVGENRNAGDTAWQFTLLAFSAELDYMRRNIVPRSAMGTGPRWTTSRPWASRFLQHKGKARCRSLPNARRN